MPENTSALMPTQSNRGGQMNALAAIIPQIMNAVGGGDMRIQQLLQQQQVENDRKMKAMQTKNAMRNIMSEVKNGKPITPELIQTATEISGADPMEVFQSVQSLDQYLTNKKAKETEQNYYRVGKSILSMPDITRNRIANVLSDPSLSDFTDEEKFKGAAIASGMMPEPKEYNLRQGEIRVRDGVEIARGLEKPTEDKYGWVRQSDGTELYMPLTPGTTKAARPQRETSKKEVERPFMAQLMADGYMPSGRITTPMLDAMETAAGKAAAQGKPLTPKDLYDMEFNSVQNRATGSTAGGRLQLARKQNVDAAYGLLDDMEKANAKLDYSPVKFIGTIEKWKSGQLNDPVFTEYMTQRADALFVLGNALKQNGLTDKSIEVEEEAFNPTLAPKAFNAWLRVQKKALDRAATEMNKDFKYGIKTDQERKSEPVGTPVKDEANKKSNDPLGIR